MDYLENYYNSFNEDERLLSQHGRIEFITTMKYIHDYLGTSINARILEVGAGTGRYSIPLAQEGHFVTAVELVEHNIEIFNSKLSSIENIEVIQGNALDLSRFTNDTFDITLVLGPMYHLYTKKDKLTALSEAVRVTKQGGIIMVAYCMNEPVIIRYVFGKGNLKNTIDMIDDSWHCKSTPKEIFELVRTEDIAEIDSKLAVERLKIIGTDGVSNYIRDRIDEMDEYTFSKWMEYHLATCERQDIIGISDHTLDILRKNQK